MVHTNLKSTSIPITEMINVCGSPLEVNGSLVLNQIMSVMFNNVFSQTS